MDLSLNGVALSSAVPSAVVLDFIEPLVGAPRFQTVNIPGKAGSWDFPEERGDRVIKVPVFINTSSISARNDAIRALAGWTDVGIRSPLIRSDIPGWYYDAILNNNQDVEVKGGHARVVPLQFVTGPYRLSVVPATFAAVATGSPDTDSFTLPSATAAAEPIIEITPVGGTLITLNLNINSALLVWTGFRSAGQILTISSVSETVTVGANDDIYLTGAYNPGNLSMEGVYGQFPLLVPGSNTWTASWNGTATSLEIDFLWRERSY